MANKRRRKANQNRTRQQPARAAATETEERERPRTRRQQEHEKHTQKPPQQGAQRVRAEKKELARRQREEIRKRIARKRRARQLLTLSIVSVGVAAAVLFITRPTPPTSALPGVLTTDAPWDANAARSAARARALHLPAEGTTQHIHFDLQIFVHGQQEPVPANIGLTDTTHTSLHTHDSSGAIHIESAKARTWRLGEFFGVWGVRFRFTPSCLGAYCDGGGSTLQVFVNGQEQTGDPTQITVNDLDVIVVTYGTPDELPNPIPSTFDFASVAP